MGQREIREKPKEGGTLKIHKEDPVGRFPGKEERESDPNREEGLTEGSQYFWVKRGIQNVG